MKTAQWREIYDQYKRRRLQSPRLSVADFYRELQASGNFPHTLRALYRYFRKFAALDNQRQVRRFELGACPGEITAVVAAPRMEIAPKEKATALLPAAGAGELGVSLGDLEFRIGSQAGAELFVSVLARLRATQLV